ncbi:MAG: twin-arginine translocation signal domain-containing protein [Planctomycetes bacterium]|nr:twin-arginine translocation signal domain-containing protein [Planctomycetota bacterium]
MQNGLNRRDFMRSTAAIGAGLFVSGGALGQTGANKDTINVALIGAGEQ